MFRTEMKCEMCERIDANTYNLQGAVTANLCPFHRTEVHTYISTELPITELLEKTIEAQHAAKDPLLFKTANAEFLDIELEVHKKLKEFIYGK